MASGKRFYWIKLRDTFFTSDTVDFFMSQPNGAQYIVLYQMLHLLTANTDGKLQRQIGEIIIPYDVPKIHRDCKWFSEDTIRVALELYRKFGLVYEDVDGALVLTDHEKMVGSETDYAEKQRLYRSEQKLLETANSEKENGYNVSEDVSRNVPIENRDKRLENRDKIEDIENYIDGGKKKKSESDEAFEAAVVEGFGKFWAIYSEIRKDTRSEAFHAFHARCKEGYSIELMCECAKNYVSLCKKEGKERKWILMPRTFVGPNLRFLEYEPKKTEKSAPLSHGEDLPSGLLHINGITNAFSDAGDK